VCVHFSLRDQAAGLPLLDDLLRRFPGVRVVLDHVGNPTWAEGPPDYGLGPLIRLADRTGIYIKFATVNLERLEAAAVAPQLALERLVGTFGAQRILWGSDAPNTPGVYAQMLARMRAALSDTPAADQEWILGGTAMHVYPQLEGQKQHARLSIAKR
jgi:predicted TIM-barrel fold metal-dependent hydrolase